MENHHVNNVIRVGLIGGTQSGKTTMLTALESYTRQMIDEKGPWTYEGADDDTDSWLEQKRIDLENGKFSTGTSGAPSNLRFLIHRNGLKVVLETQERPGGDYDNRIDDEMIGYLSSCNGLIFLISAKPEETDTHTSDLIRRLLRKIDKKRGGGEATGTPLPQRVAVCLSQYDETEFFQWLKEKNLLERKNENGVNNTPYLPPKNVERAIREWYRLPDGDRILQEFHTRFDPDLVNFFALSSIGFYIKPRGDTIDWSDCGNVLITPQGDRIRNAPTYRPVNLLDPLSWIISNKGSGWRGGGWRVVK